MWVSDTAECLVFREPRLPNGIAEKLGDVHFHSAAVERRETSAGRVFVFRADATDRWWLLGGQLCGLGSGSQQSDTHNLWNSHWSAQYVVNLRWNTAWKFVPVSVFVDVEGSHTLYLKVLTQAADERAFSIKITQLRDNLAPQGCFQYFTTTEGIIKTFNYEDNSQVVLKRRPSYFVSRLSYFQTTGLLSGLITPILSHHYESYFDRNKNTNSTLHKPKQDWEAQLRNCTRAARDSNPNIPLNTSEQHQHFHLHPAKTWVLQHRLHKRVERQGRRLPAG